MITLAREQYAMETRLIADEHEGEVRSTDCLDRRADSLPEGSRAHPLHSRGEDGVHAAVELS